MTLEKILTAEERVLLSTLVEKATRVAMTCHVNPDGDAVGSMTAAVQLMRRLGKEVVGVVPNGFPDNLKWMAGAAELLLADKDPAAARGALEGADLIFCLDYNGPARAGDLLGGILRECQAPKVMLDHHLHPEDFCTVTVSHPQMCSTCEVLLHVMDELGWTAGMTHDEAASLYTGMMTDTGSFTYASSRPEVYECISLLLRHGIDKDRIYRNVFWTSTEGRLQLMGYLLYVKMEVMRQQGAALITLTNEEYRRFSLKNGDTEGFVNLPLQIEGVKLSIFLREDTEVKGKIRVSTRSVDDFPCNELAAEFFHGGGHKNAAGGSFLGTIDEAVETAHRAIKKYESLLK